MCLLILIRRGVFVFGCIDFVVKFIFINFGLYFYFV